MGNILSGKSLVIIFMINIEANEKENLFDGTLKSVKYSLDWATQKI